MHHIRGSVKDYPWGKVDGLVPWLGDRAPEHAGTTQAELWFGVHPSGPSPLMTRSGATLTDELAREQAPVLAKILAAAQPLSVQVHPNAHDAKKMWETQQIAGPQVLADPYEKAEVILALESFDAFVGWRPTSDAAEIIERIDGLALAAAALHAGDRVAAIQSIVERRADASEFAHAVPTAVEHARESGKLSRALTDVEIAAYRQAAADFPEDIGVALTPLLDFRTLEVGQAVYLAPGIPHSYVRGTGFEVMTSSDNVLRLGLTGKPVFIDHAIPILDFTSAPQYLEGDTLAPEGAVFCLQVLKQSSQSFDPGDYRLIVAIDGPCTVTVDDTTITAEQGTAVAITAAEGRASVVASGVSVVVQAPIG